MIVNQQGHGFKSGWRHDPVERCHIVKPKKVGSSFRNGKEVVGEHLADHWVWPDPPRV